MQESKTPPEGAIACCEPDPITGHWPHWVKVDSNNPADKWFYGAYIHSGSTLLSDGTYEAVGPHFQGNPYELYCEELVKHGDSIINVGRLGRLDTELEMIVETGIRYGLN